MLSLPRTDMVFLSIRRRGRFDVFRLIGRNHFYFFNMYFDFQNDKGQWPSEIYIFIGGRTIGVALIVPKGCVLPDFPSPVLHVNKMKLSELHWDEDDPNADGGWGTIRKGDGENSVVVVSDFAIPDGAEYQCKVPDCEPSCLFRVIEHFNSLLDMRVFLGRDFLFISTDRSGRKMIAPVVSFHHTGERFHLDEYPFERTEIYGVSVPLEEYIQCRKSDDFADWYRHLLDGAEKRVLPLSPYMLFESLRLAVGVCRSKTLSAVLCEGLPDGLYLDFSSDTLFSQRAGGGGL